MNREIDCRWVKSYLGADETVLWSGKPGKGHLLTRADIFMIPFSILWCSFAIFWEASVLSEGAPWPFKLFGIPFVLVGLYITVGRFVHKVYIRKRTEYVITNQRFLRLRGKKVDTVEVQSKDQINVTINKDGSGTIFLAPPVPSITSPRCGFSRSAASNISKSLSPKPSAFQQRRNGSV